MARASTGMAFGRIAGKMGDFVVVETRSGLALRKKATYRKAVSPRQRAASDRLKGATAVWNGLSAAQAQAWNRYAAGLTHHSSMTGEAYSPIGFNAFTGLAMRVLQVDPAATVPLVPPTGKFMGDGVIVECGLSIVEGPAEDREGRGLHNPQSSVQNGAIAFQADRANAPGVVTELLVQRLVNERRSPSQSYNSAGFVAFSAGHLSADVPVEAGVYACAYRFVERATGRATGLTPLGVVTVG